MAIQIFKECQNYDIILYNRKKYQTTRYFFHSLTYSAVVKAYGRHPTGATITTALFHKTVPFAQSPTFVHHYLPNPFFQSTLAQS